MEVNNEWELSKENVQPLRQGRRMSELQKALKNDPSSNKKEIQEFEMELRNKEDTPEEQLEIWYRYIVWVEENTLRWKKESYDLMQRCTIHFNGRNEFYQNKFFLLIWLKFADCGDDPNIMFDYMLDHDIGTSLALFYKAWGEHFEMFGSLKKADDLYNLGINRNAEPVDILLECKREFERRLSKIERKDNTEETEMLQKSSRQVLAGLKVNKAGRVANNRMKNKDGKSQVETASGLTGNLSNKSSLFAIYGDDKSVPSLHNVGTKQYTQLPIGKAINAENIKPTEKLRGSKVNGLKVPRTGGVTTTSTKFEIFSEHDENEEQSTSKPTPRQVVVSARKPLSMKKEVDDPYKFYDRDKPSEDPKFAFCYCKHLIYMGTQEVSFDELKAQKLKNNPDRTNTQAKKNLFDNNAAARTNSISFTSIDPDNNSGAILKKIDEAKTTFSQPTEMTVVLNQLKDNPVRPTYESTAVIDTKKIQKPAVHLMTPENDVQNKKIKTKSDYCDIYKTLEQTVVLPSQSLKTSDLDDSDLGVIPFSDSPRSVNRKVTADLLNDLEMTQHNILSKWSLETEDSDKEVDNFTIVGDCVSTGQQLLTMAEEDDMSSETHPPEEVEILKKINRVALDNFGIKDLNSDKTMDGVEMDMSSRKTSGNLCMTTQNQIRDMKENDWENNSMVDQLKALNDSLLVETSPLQKTDPILKEEKICQQEIVSATPKCKAISNVRGSLCAPSPTVYTKDAIDNVASMFSATLDQEKFDFSSEDLTEAGQTYELQFAKTKENAKENVCSMFEIFADPMKTVDRQPPKTFETFSDPMETVGCQPPKGFEIFADPMETVDRQPPKTFEIFADPMGTVDRQPPKIFEIFADSMESVDRQPPKTFEIFADPMETVDRQPPKTFEIFADPMETVDRQPPKTFEIFGDPMETVDRQPPKTFEIFADPKETVDRQPPKKFETFAKPMPVGGAQSNTFEILPESLQECRLLKGSLMNQNAPADPAAKLKDTCKIKKKSLGTTEIGKSTFTQYRDFSERSLCASPVKSNSLTNLNQTAYMMLLDRTVTGKIQPIKAASTPFNPADKMSVTFEHEVSDITTENQLIKSGFAWTCNQSILSPIQERSNESPNSTGDDESHISSENGLVINVFDPVFKKSMVDKIMTVIQSAKNYINLYGLLPKLQGPSLSLQLGERHYDIKMKMKEGKFSVTYKAVNDLNQLVILKITKTEVVAALWDFYISQEIHQRLSQNFEVYTNLRDNFLQHNLLYKCVDAVCVETLYSEGTLQDLINCYVKHGVEIEESLAMLYTCEILRIVRALHSVNILHANLNPENFSLVNCDLCEDGPLALRCLKLHNFRNSVDLALINGVIVGSHNSVSYECPEMITKKPWRDQADYYAAAATIHMLVFQTGMTTFVDPNSKFLRVSGDTARRRGWDQVLWPKLFSTLINSSGETILLFFINELAIRLTRPETIEQLDEAITHKEDLLMRD